MPWITEDMLMDKTILKRKGDGKVIKVILAILAAIGLMTVLTTIGICVLFVVEDHYWKKGEEDDR